MFKENKETTKGLGRVMDAASDLRRGDVLSYTEITRLTGFTRDSSNWTAFLARLRKQLRQKRGVTLTAVANVGYRIDTVSDQLHTRSVRRQRKAVRQMDRDVKELDALPDAELSDHERAVKQRKIDQGKTGRRAVLYSLRLAHKFTKPSSSGIPRVRR